MKERNVILGIDGVPFELICNLSNKDVMPNFKELKKEFTFKKMNSSIPHISSVSWSSIITGKNPGEHGIYGFSEMIPNTYSLSFPNFNALKSKPFWHREQDKKHIIINVPATYPAKELNGIHIAGFVALDIEKAVYPKEYIKFLHELDYKIDVDAKLAHQQSKHPFINELFDVLKVRKKTYKLFWSKLNWKNFMIVLTGSDRMGHFLWHIIEDNTNQYYERVLDYFRKIDNIIGDLKNRLKEKDNLIIISDHGMEHIDINVNLNTFLAKEGFLDLSNNLKRYNRVSKKSKAFVLDPSRVYLNKKGKFPNGSVLKEDEKEIINELETLFYDLKFKKKNVIKKVNRKESIYSGKMIDKAPDLVLLENKGFNPKSIIGKEDIFEQENLFTGKHNENAFLFINRDINIKEPNVENVIELLK